MCKPAVPARSRPESWVKGAHRLGRDVFATQLCYDCIKQCI